MPLPSSAAKSNVTPIARLEKKPKAAKGLKRSQMERKPSTLKKTVLGKTTEAQKERCADQVCVACGKWFGLCEPAHVVPRGTPKLSDAAADDVRAVVPLCPGLDGCHRKFDENRLDLLPHLEPTWRDSQEWAAGAVGLASALRSITGEAHLRVVSDDGEREIDTSALVLKHELDDGETS
jgi:hypothetical protein